MNSVIEILAETFFIVEATSFEKYCLEKQNTPLRRWEQINLGYSVTVGQLDKRPICLSMSWARIDGQLIMFWEATSQVVDSVQIDAWFAKHFTGKWDNGDREAKTDAMNFHQCLIAIAGAT